MLGEGATSGINASFGSQKFFSGVMMLVKKTQNFAWVDILILIIVICLLMQKKSLNLKSKIKMLTFLLNFALEACLMDLVLLSLEKYL